jgi:BirA family biotin operon repressor/biotin-[acetyl-CoA-carboxylase] ligase
VTTVVGIGLNLTQTREGLAAANLPEATSLAIATGKVVDAQAAATVVIRTLDAEYARLLAGEQLAVEADWKWRIGLLGRSVIIEHLDGGTTTGRLREMGFDRLEVETTPGVMRAVAPETVAHILAASPGGSD